MFNKPHQESMTVEFKSDIKKLPDSEILDTIVAFANTSGGTLYLGIEDDGTVTGAHRDHLQLQGLAAYIANQTIPPISVRAEILVFDGKKVVCIESPMSTSIVATSKGKVLRRRLKFDGSPESAPFYPFEFATRLSNLKLLDLSAQPVPESSLDDFDANEIRLLQEHIQNQRAEPILKELPFDELCQALRLTTTVNGNAVPTYTGIIILGKANRIKELMPTIGYALQVFVGSALKINNDFCKPLLSSLKELESGLLPFIHESEFSDGFYRISVPDVDFEALREAIINAVAHRDYSQLGRIRIEWSSEGLTVANPGGFIAGVNENCLLDAEPYGRNPALAEALKRIGLAERTGRGIDRIFSASVRYGRRRPTYHDSTEQTVQLFIPRVRIDQGFSRVILQSKYQFSTYELLILGTLNEIRAGTAEEICRLATLNSFKGKVAIENLLEAGFIESHDRKSYSLSSLFYKENKNEVAYVRRADIDRIRRPELVLKLVKTKGRIQRQDVVELLHISNQSATMLLKAMVLKGQLMKHGDKRTAYYTIPTNA